MTNDLTYLIPLLAFVAAASVLPIAGWLVTRGRQPCPHCGRRAARTIQSVHSVVGGARALIYACRSCNGSVRYARRPDGREFWEPMDGPAGRPS